MPQNEYMEEHARRFGKRFDHEEVQRKKKARSVKKDSKMAKKLRGIKAKLFHKKKYIEKATMKKTIKMHEEKDAKLKDSEEAPKGIFNIFLFP